MTTETLPCASAPLVGVVTQPFIGLSPMFLSEYSKEDLALFDLAMQGDGADDSDETSDDLDDEDDDADDLDDDDIDYDDDEDDEDDDPTDPANDPEYDPFGTDDDDEDGD